MLQGASVGAGAGAVVDAGAGAGVGAGVGVVGSAGAVSDGGPDMVARLETLRRWWTKGGAWHHGLGFYMCRPTSQKPIERQGRGRTWKPRDDCETHEGLKVFATATGCPLAPVNAKMWRRSCLVRVRVWESWSPFFVFFFLFFLLVGIVLASETCSSQAWLAVPLPFLSLSPVTPNTKTFPLGRSSRASGEGILG